MDDFTPGAAGENALFSADLDSTFDDTPDTGEVIEAASDATTDDLPPVDDAEAEPAPLVETDTPPVETAPLAEVTPPAEALPEGVRVLEKDGKKEFRLTEARYRTIEEGHHFRRELEQRLVPLTEEGKPVTTEDIRKAIELRDQAFLGNERMQLDFLSGDARNQGAFVDHWIRQGAEAVANGEVAADPFVPFAANLYDTIEQKHPDAFAMLQFKATSTLIKDLYELAKSENDTNLMRSAQHVEKRFFNRYLNDEGNVIETPPKQPVAARPAPARQNQPAAQPAPDQQWQNFRVKADTDSKGVVHKIVETSLASIKTAYDKAQSPETYGAVLDRLNSVVHKELKGDAAWQSQINIELQKARLTPSEQKRQEIAARIVRRYESRARQIVEKHLPTITSEASRLLNVKIDATHARRAAVQDKRAPAGGGPPAKTSLIPTKDTGPWTGKASFDREIDALFA